jgi:hypothetical protein
MIDVRFREAAFPPVEIALRAELQKQMGRLCLFEVEATASGRRLASGQLALALEGGEDER